MNTKNHVLQVRLTVDEYEKLKAAADKKHLTVSAYIRMMVLPLLEDQNNDRK